MTILEYVISFLCISYCSIKPKKKLIDVYRAVFSLRREVFTNRPIPNDAGKTSLEDEQWFQRQCNAICATLMFLICVLDPAVPQENGINMISSSFCTFVLFSPLLKSQTLMSFFFFFSLKMSNNYLSHHIGPICRTNCASDSHHFLSYNEFY